MTSEDNGGSLIKFDIQEGGGDTGKTDDGGQGEEGGPKSQKIYGFHSSVAPYNVRVFI